MSLATSTSARPGSAPALPNVRLDVSQGGRTVPYVFDQVDFLIGAVAGCDLRVPGTDLPAVLCLIARHPSGVRLRRLAPTQLMLLNGQPVSRADLSDGDRITIGAIDIVVRVEKVALLAEELVAVETVERDIETEQLQAELDERAASLANERRSFEQERDELRKLHAAWEKEKSAAPKTPVRQEIGADLLQREMAVARRDEELTRRAQSLDSREAEIERHKQEIAAVRQELSDIRQQLHDRYQERRDRLAGLQEAVDRAARKVQESKREFQASCLEFASQKADVERRDAELTALRTQLASARTMLESEREQWTASQAEIQAELSAKLADLAAREDKIASQKATVEAREKQYQADLVRMERRLAELERHEKTLAEQSANLLAKHEQMQTDAAELESQAREIDALRSQFEIESAEFTAKKNEHEARQKQLDERAAALEGQQTALTTLRSKLERMRDEFRQHDQTIEAQRLVNEEALAKIAARQKELDRLEAERRAEADLLANEKQHVAERQAMMNAAFEKLKAAQDRLAADELAIKTQSRELDERLIAHAEQEALLKGRLEQVAEAQARLDLERQALRERTVALAQTEQAREALQEQLRRRADELAQKQKQLHEYHATLQAQEAAFAEREVALVADFETRRIAIDADRRVLEEQDRQLALRREELAQLEQLQQSQVEQLHDKSRAIAEQARLLAQQQAANQEEWKREQQMLAAERADLDAMRKEAGELLLELPNVELRAGTAVDQLSHAREQLRDHLGEIQAFVRQSHDDLAAAHARLRLEETGLAGKEADFRRLHDEHRLALVAFRQQMIDWQAQIKAAQRTIKSEDKALDVRQSRVEAQSQIVVEGAEKLAAQGAVMEVQQEIVAEQRGELDRHVGDLRGWYRQKMRELAGGAEEAEIVDATASQIEGEDSPLVPTDRDILSITGPVDAADRALADALVKSHISDENAVHAMLVEARRQRRTLRQVLVASGAVTPYQLALLETHQAAELDLGPFRVIDRIRQTQCETIYRAFDPRRGQEVLVRHLSEQASLDAVLPDEYRQRFSRLILGDAHVAGALETLDINGRAAVVQEWLVGLPASDWPPLAAAPGVCYRLLTQAALGLSALHTHGLVHGRLTERCILLTPQGQLRVAGANEPAWLHGDAPAAGDDLVRLGHIVAGWCTPSGVRKGPKTKPLPDSMMAILDRMRSPDGYADAKELLADLDRAGDDVPANPEAWDRLLRYVRDHAVPAALKQSA